MESVTVRRPITIWLLIVVMLIFGISGWHDKLMQVPVHGYSFIGEKARTLGLIAPFVALLAAGYDLYRRFVRNDRLEFTGIGIGDYASPNRLGQIRWSAIDDLEFRKSWYGSTVTIRFKEGVPINDQIGSWDKLIVDELAITNEDLAGIRSILGALGLSACLQAVK